MTTPEVEAWKKQRQAALDADWAMAVARWQEDCHTATRKPAPAVLVSYLVRRLQEVEAGQALLRAEYSTVSRERDEAISDLLAIASRSPANDRILGGAESFPEDGLFAPAQSEGTQP